MNALENGVYDVLTIASVADDPEMVSLALELGNAPDLVTSVYDGTALIAAAHLGHHEVVARLVAGGAPFDHIKTVQILVDAEQINPSVIVMASLRWTTRYCVATKRWLRC